MAFLSWLSKEDTLTPAALTVRAQAVPADDADNLLYPLFFPRENVRSVDLKDISTVDFRPVADRRAWNGYGRRLGLKTGPVRDVRISPIEANYKLEEQELQRLGETAGVSETAVRQIIGADIPMRVDMLARAVQRRVEMDAMRAWALGNLTVRNPETNGTITVSMGFAGARYTTASAAWNASGGWADFMAWYAAARQLAGPGEGVVLRYATLAGLLTQAPTLLNGARMRRREVEDEVSQTFGENFRFLTVENSFDEHQTAGMVTTRTNVWPAQRAAFLPAGAVVGRTAQAPNVRAMSVAQGSPLDINPNGISITLTEHANGRELDIEAQANWVSLPDESKVVVINAGV